MLLSLHVRSTRELFCITVTKKPVLVPFGFDKFTPDKTLEAGRVQAKTQMAVQSLPMTELQIGEPGTVC